MMFTPRPLPRDSIPGLRPSPGFPGVALSAFPDASRASSTTLSASLFEVVIAEFTARWERGESPRVEDYLDRLRPEQSAERVDLIFREFCMAGWAGLDPRPDDYLARFPAQAEALERLFRVDEVLGSRGLRLWDEPPEAIPLPEVGNEIGPYRLIRELGRGAFARVFLAEQSDLVDRLVVVKVSNRVTPESSLLARAGHPHIAAVLWHGEADGGSLQIICMPFLGGASLSAVLAERLRRGTRPGSGRNLLDDLDRVSADGYLPPSSGRPSRELIARLSYPGASAWVVARLAEALDFAFGRGVIHGDVKPSNVLLTADGTPMLLDFNLSVGWRPHAGARGPAGDSGGTLAYMAPERLRSVADPGHAAQATASGRHRADIYSLGVLLLEMLTGRPPEPPGSGRLSPRELASFYVSSREHGGEVMIRSARTPLPAGLKAILRRCLAPDPADRYRRASELAEDLDLWRADRPLVFAREPGRGLGLLRSVRRRRRVLASLTTGLAFAAAVAAVSWYRSEIDQRERALIDLRKVYHEALSASPVRRPGLGLVQAQGNPAEIARRFLDRYGVLGAGDWRQRDDVRKLPALERDELEVWLLEQALRFAHTLGERPDYGNWLRALVNLRGVAATSPFGPILAECRDLRRQLIEQLHRLDREAAASPTGPILSECRELRRQLDELGPLPAGNSPALAAWKNEYLLGVGAELRGASRDALRYYQAALKHRPGLFWASYRAAAVAFRQGDYHEAAERLKACVDQDSDNPLHHHHLAGCLYWDQRYQEAAEECDKAQSLDPDHAETYVTRSFLRIQLKQFPSVVKDLNAYDVLTGHPVLGASRTPALDLTRSAAGVENNFEVVGLGARPAVVPDPEESPVRLKLASDLSMAERHDIALEQYDRVLEMDPDDLPARYGRAVQRRYLGRVDADEDFDLVARHPQVESLVRKTADGIKVFHYTATSQIRRGKIEEAISTARLGVRIADRLERMQAESYYILARVYALAAKTHPGHDRDAVESLSRAYQLSPRAVGTWYLSEPAFEDMRAEFGRTPFQAR